MKKNEELKKIRSKSVKELNKMLKDKILELNKLRIVSSFGKNKKTSEFKSTRKTISRIMTIINEAIYSKTKDKENI